MTNLGYLEIVAFNYSKRWS